MCGKIQRTDSQHINKLITVTDFQKMKSQKRIKNVRKSDLQSHRQCVSLIKDNLFYYEKRFDVNNCMSLRAK